MHGAHHDADRGDATDGGPTKWLPFAFADGAIRRLWGKVEIEGRDVETQIHGWDVQSIR